MSENRQPVDRVADALASGQSEKGLRDVVRALLIEGNTRRQVIDILESYRSRLGDDAETEDELALDYIAILSGWASKTAQRELMPPLCEMPHSSLAL